MNKKEIVEWRGVENLVAAEVLEDTTENYTTGTVFDIAGVAEISRTTDSSSEVKFYDNIPAAVNNSTGADTVTCSTSAIPTDILAKLTGQKYLEDLGALVEGERKVKYFALGYKTKKTNGDEVYVWRYKGTFNIPDSVHKTKDNGTESNGQELVYTGISTTHKFDKTGEHAKALNVDLGRDLAETDTFFDTVTTVDTLRAKAAA